LFQIYPLNIQKFIILGPLAPTNVVISDNQPNQLAVNWEPHCTTTRVCNEFGNNRIPQRYAIKYKPAGAAGNGMKVYIDDVHPVNFPPTEVTLNELSSNTEYEISVMTTTMIDTDKNRTINSDFTIIITGITGNLFIFFLSLV